MKAAILGGGIMGVTLGYLLSRRGVTVEVFEASPNLGGLAGPLTLDDGTEVDRYYHAILSSDSFLRELCTELGIADRLRFRQTRMGFFYQGRVYSMNSTLEFLRFPPLGWIDRLRLGLTVVYAQMVRDWTSLEGVDVEKWLVQLSGRRTYENIWRPLLKAKFDGGFERTPATYIWARLVRMKSTRGGANQKEEAGYIIGGYQTLVKAMAERIEAAGGTVHLRCPVQEVAIDGGRARGVRVNGELHPFDAVIGTMQTPIFQRLIPGAPKQYHDFLNQRRYLGIVSPLMILDRPLTGYWTINMTDDRFPFTGVIETTAYIDPKHVGGYHLVYLPKYTAPGSPLLTLSDEEIRETWLSNLEQMFPDFDRRSVRYFLVNRERFVEPIHELNSRHLIPPVKTAVEALYLVTTAQIYPDLTNGEAVARHAARAAETVLESLAVRRAVPEAAPATAIADVAAD
ncbi:MAG: NAD(P)/FAD-dependent oxidoreductase [Chloroflexales bacterium]|nr:NAD(P)/FAD-dependent oxidoreductase [Chloroflexales bacterium]